MNRIKVFDFGPELGPLSGRRPEPVQGKGLVWVGSSPLDPGHFVLGPAPLIGVDEPIGGDPGIGGGGGLGGGNRGEGGGGSGGSSGSGVRRGGIGWTPVEPDDPSGEGFSEIGCSMEAIRRIGDAYERLMKSKEWVRALSDFPDLLYCMRETWRRRNVRCVNTTLRENPLLNFQTIIDSDGQAIRIMTFSYGDIRSDDFLIYRIVQQLVWACGGTLIDAYAISSVIDNVLFTELASSSAKLVLLSDPTLHSEQDFDLSEVWIGKWVMWNPFRGDIYDLNQYGRRIVPNPKLSRRSQEQVREWYRIP